MCFDSFLSIFHTCSIGFKCGEYAGRYIKLIFKNSATVFTKLNL